jgi:hypothetical protein
MDHIHDLVITSVTQGLYERPIGEGRAENERMKVAPHKSLMGVEPLLLNLTGSLLEPFVKGVNVHEGPLRQRVCCLLLKLQPASRGMSPDRKLNLLQQEFEFREIALEVQNRHFEVGPHPGLCFPPVKERIVAIQEAAISVAGKAGFILHTRFIQFYFTGDQGAGRQDVADYRSAGIGKVPVDKNLESVEDLRGSEYQARVVNLKHQLSVSELQDGAPYRQTLNGG